MSSMASSLQHKTWTRGNYLVSTNPSLICIKTLNAAFASDDIYWANPLPEDVWRETLQNSLCFGLYEILNKGTINNETNNLAKLPSEGHSLASENGEVDKEDLRFIGLARCITDFTTFIYLTDVYISPAYQGKGLGKWLIGCVQEVIESMQYLRRSLLFTSNWKQSVPFYEANMGMSVIECKGRKDGMDGEGLAVLMRLGKGAPGYKSDNGI